MTEVDTRVIDLTINLESPSRSKTGFGNALFATPSTDSYELVKEYTKNEVSTNFPSGHWFRKALEAHFNQNPSPSAAKIGRVAADDFKVNVTSANASYNYAMQFAGLRKFTVSAGTLGAAGSAELKFSGTASDVDYFSVGEEFTYSGDSTATADGTYTVLSLPSYAAGVITVPVEEAIAAATFDGTIILDELGSTSNIEYRESFSATGGNKAASQITFAGDAGDAAKFSTNLNFVYSGDSVSTSNRTYSVASAIHAAGVVTVTTNEAIVGIGAPDGTLRLNANTWTVTGGVHTGVAGADDFTFAGDADDASKFQVGDTFAYAGDTNAASNGTYTVRALGTHLAGVVTVAVEEAIPAATADDGDITLALNRAHIAMYLDKAINDDTTVSAYVTSSYTAPNQFLTVTNVTSGEFYQMKIGKLVSSAFTQDWSYMNIDYLYGIQALGATARTSAWQNGLDAIKLYDNDWYGLAIPSNKTADQSAVADWAFGKNKRLVLRSNDRNLRNLAESADSTSIGYLAKDAGYDCAIIWHGKATQDISTEQFIDMAWLGARLWIDPDIQTTTWFSVNLVGITADLNDQMTSTYRNNLEAKYCNYYTSDGVQNVTYLGTVSDGNFIDTYTLAHWLYARIAEGTLAIIHNASQRGAKIPFTNTGIAAVTSAFIEYAERGIATEGIFKDLVTYPDVGYEFVTLDISEVDATDRSVLRLLKGTRLSVSAAGAIHGVAATINITV